MEPSGSATAESAPPIPPTLGTLLPPAPVPGWPPVPGEAVVAPSEWEAEAEPQLNSPAKTNGPRTETAKAIRSRRAQTSPCASPSIGRPRYVSILARIARAVVYEGRVRSGAAAIRGRWSQSNPRQSKSATMAIADRLRVVVKGKEEPDTTTLGCLHRQVHRYTTLRRRELNNSIPIQSSRMRFC
jgi:hypothetical protein